MASLRALIAILLLVLIVLPVVSPSLALGQDTGAGLPACCRRTGKHHCAMDAAERLQGGATIQEQKAVKAPLERCPYAPATLGSNHGSRSALPASGVAFLHSVSLVGAVRSAECTWRIAQDRARHKRGPPQGTSPA